MSTPQFRNQSYFTFSNLETRQQMEQTLRLIQSQLGRDYDLQIGECSQRTEKKIVSINPSQPSEIIGCVSSADQALAEKALQAAWRAFPSWSRYRPADRAAFLFHAAELMRQRSMEFSSWMVLEIGKSWAEADADTSEAIDFMEFYAREALRYAEEQPLTPLEGEKNELRYLPLGVGVVIPPWNFPLAILVGMTTAAIVAGNTVVLKPSSDTPVIAAKFVELMKEIGLPPGVINYLPGSGSEIGDFLVSHPQTRFITFTGSKEVGLRINRLAAEIAPGQKWIKRVIAEMGGKDAIVVDETANLDAAAAGICASAFGFQGQKCSACSRAIVVESVYSAVLEKTVELARKIQMGPVIQFENQFGPVASRSALRTIRNYIEIGKQEGRLVLGGVEYGGDGFFVPPTIFADIAPKARLSQEEIFGPVLAFTPAADWRQALELANDTEFGLTGAFYSNDRLRIQEAKDRFFVGNCYINRKCTGALVGVHPFGGFHMSGTDSKAGGRDYLLLFLQAKLISEKIMG